MRHPAKLFNIVAISETRTPLWDTLEPQSHEASDRGRDRPTKIYVFCGEREVLSLELLIMIMYYL